MHIKPIFGAAALAFVLASCADVPTPGATGSEVPAPSVDVANVPVGHPDPQGRANMVVSPYRPYNVIDVKGYRSGEIVGDPSTAKVNPTTGKYDSSSAKYFRVP
ncbi:MAG: hypothetical protein AB8F34_11955 [Akkermansiaceae bacterium]